MDPPASAGAVAALRKSHPRNSIGSEFPVSTWDAGGSNPLGGTRIQKSKRPQRLLKVPRHEYRAMYFIARLGQFGCSGIISRCLIQ